MIRYTVKGYTGPNADFTATVELPAPPSDGFGGDHRYSALWNALKDQLSGSACPSDYLMVLDDCDWEVRGDLANSDGEVVLLAESYGCDNCMDALGDGAGWGDNNWTDGCNDDPHGGFMLVFSPVAGCRLCGDATCDCMGDGSDLCHACGEQVSA